MDILCNKLEYNPEIFINLYGPKAFKFPVKLM